MWVWYTISVLVCYENTCYAKYMWWECDIQSPLLILLLEPNYFLTFELKHGANPLQLFLSGVTSFCLGSAVACIQAKTWKEGQMVHNSVFIFEVQCYQELWTHIHISLSTVLKQEGFLVFAVFCNFVTEQCRVTNKKNKKLQTNVSNTCIFQLSVRKQEDNFKTNIKNLFIKLSN